MTRQSTTEQIMTVVRDFNRRGEPIYLSKLMELITESAEPTICKYVNELIEEGKLKDQWVHNFDRRGNTRVLYAYDYYGDDRTADPQMERVITELHGMMKQIGRLNDNLERIANKDTVKAVGPVVIQNKKIDGPKEKRPKVITMKTKEIPEKGTLAEYMQEGEE